MSSLIALVDLGLVALLLPYFFPKKPARLVLPSPHSFFPAKLILTTCNSAFSKAPAVLLLGLNATLLVFWLYVILLAAPICLLVVSFALFESFILFQYLYLFYYNLFHVIFGLYIKLIFQKR